MKKSNRFIESSTKLGRNSVSYLSSSETLKSVKQFLRILQFLSAKDKKMLDGRNGLVVTKASGPAVSSQIREGDIILALNNTPVTSVRAFNREINKTPKGKTIALLIYRNGDTLFVPVKVLN